MFRIVASVLSLLVLVGAFGLNTHAQTAYTWVAVPVSGASPSPRVGHQMVFDSARNRVILFGGQTTDGCCSGQHNLTGDLLNDMWEWDGATQTWSNVTPSSGPVPPARSFFGMAYDPSRGKVVIFGGKQDAIFWNTNGDTWEWDPVSRVWTAFPSAISTNYLGRRGLQLAYDPNLGQVILFGGIVYWGDFYNETFAWDGSNWIVKSTTGPLGRQGHGMTTDFGRSKVVMVGGYNYYDGGSAVGYSETWEWDGTSWSQTTSTGPERRIGGAMNYDFARGVNVLFGGTIRNPDYGPPTFNDTWELTGSVWSVRPTQYTPPPRDSVMAFDGTKMILFGGRQNDGSILGDTLALVPTDTIPPLTNVSNSSAPNAAGWNTTNVDIILSSVDNAGGSGVETVTYSAIGAQPIASTTVSGSAANLTITAEGTTTVTYFAEDNAGNVEAAKTLVIKIDKTAPAISITSPTNGSYVLNQAATVGFSCSDGISGIASCTGSSGDGSALDTSTVGSKSVTVDAVDNAGNTSSTTVNYTVGYGVQVLYDQTRAHKSGSTIPIKVRLVDANGVNVSSPSLVPHAISVIQTSSQASTSFGDAGNSNPDFDFRYSPDLGGYIFNLQTTGFGTGTYNLNFVAGGSQPIYSVGFQVRQ